MPLREDLLEPIPGENPSGASLRYNRVYDQIKEARTEEDESLPSGEWKRQAKRADFALVIRVAGEALAKRSKDLQLAAWLTEAHCKREGIALLAPCLRLLLQLQGAFWETLYPEIEDGDAGLRAMPLEWVSGRLANFVREIALTRGGFSHIRYKESRAIGYEADAQYNDAKREQREQGVQEGKPTAEEFDADFAGTPRGFYLALDAALRDGAEALTELEQFCDEHYAADAPSFGKLRSALEEVGNTVSILVSQKGGAEPDSVVLPDPESTGAEAPESEPMARPEEAPEAQAYSAPEPPPAPASDDPASSRWGATPTRAAIPEGGAGAAPNREPSGVKEALDWIRTGAAYLAEENPASPVGYFAVFAPRQGELREQGAAPAPEGLPAPPTEMRQRLRRLAGEGDWGALLRAALTALSEPCGRAWVDPHRFVWKAATELGYAALAEAVLSTVRTLLRDYPDLPALALDDDTPAANAETRRWIAEQDLSVEAPPGVNDTAAVARAPAMRESLTAPGAEDERAEDAAAQSAALLRQGRAEEAIRLLAGDAARQPSGRGRFQRRVQIAQLCVAAGQPSVAQSMLVGLLREMDDRRLEEWEPPETIAPALLLLLRSLNGAGESDPVRSAAFARLCRVDPAAAAEFTG